MCKKSRPTNPNFLHLVIPIISINSSRHGTNRTDDAEGAMTLQDIVERKKKADAARGQELSDALLGNAEAAKKLHLSPQTLRLWRHQGRGPPYIKLGRAVFYHPADIDAFIEAQRRDPKR